jgi:hypothetical protein
VFIFLSGYLVQVRKGKIRARTRLPFVFRLSDGQVGPLKAPVGKSLVVPISAEMARRLAYYKAEDGDGVLAPRGWHCFGTYGSNGASLYVSHEPIRSDEVIFAKHQRGFTGPVVQLSTSNGDTSGRFNVARIMARVFPAHRDFVRNVIEEKIEPASAFPSGPYPKDKVTYKGSEAVDYETPADAIGLGTQSLLQKNGDPIRGVALLVGEALARPRVSRGAASREDGGSCPNHHSPRGARCRQESRGELNAREHAEIARGEIAAHDLFEEIAEDGGGGSLTAPGSLTSTANLRKLGRSRGLQEQAAVGVRVDAHALEAARRDGGDRLVEAAFAVEELFRFVGT